MGINFHKGHGTRNDFVIIEDLEGMRELTPELVRQLADRRSGIGGDGVIRVVRGGAFEEWEGDPDLWFMDYWNADGSIAEMCGNGLRVFACHLLEQQLVDQQEFDVATRAGVKHVRRTSRGIAVHLGAAEVADDVVRVDASGRVYDAHPVDVGNPHAVAFVPFDDLPRMDLHEAPTWTPVERFPDGVNVEFVVVDGPDRLRMRVHERGSGETQSCGTGVVAAAAAHRRVHAGHGAVRVEVPGGVLTVDFDETGAILTGPAVIVASGHVRTH